MNRYLPKYYRVALFIWAGMYIGLNAQSQDLEPRFMSNMPIGSNVAVASYANSSGNILLETALPIEDLSSNINSAVFAYVRSFKLFNKLAKADVIVPYAFANFSGLVDSRDSSTYRQGLGDPSFRLSMTLIGANPLKPGDFFKQEHARFRLGVLARFRVPLGQYKSQKLINLGTNRYSVKLGLAGSYDLTKKLVLEAHANTWLFTENNSFFNGNTIKQKPMISFQSHLSYEFKPGIWAAISYGGSNLGETILNGVEKNDTQRNSRMGAAFAFRLKKGNALKIAATSGISTRYGADYTTFIVAYQYLWFDKPKIN